MEDLSQDETDRAVPLSEPIAIQRRSPLIRNHKTGSMEVMLPLLLLLGFLPLLVSEGTFYSAN